ncbi:MAG: DUF371 domain-containing protein [Nitrososphaerota archaeon]|nr:DUF371 domain-containing protein [Nitrososphaerota archaeon]
MGSDSEDMLEELQFYGHQNVLATHYNTLEITTEEEISKRADCIIGVKGNKGCLQLNQKLRDYIHKSGWLKFTLSVDDRSFSFIGKGDPKLELSDPREIVIRKSDFVSSRTAALHCNAAARDIPREIVRQLQRSDSTGKLCISALRESDSIRQ